MKLRNMMSGFIVVILESIWANNYLKLKLPHLDSYFGLNVVCYLHNVFNIHRSCAEIEGLKSKYM